MSIKKWIVGAPDREKAKVLAEECDIDPFAALVAVGRGVDNEGELELLISDEPILCDPLELKDIKLAADYINKAIQDNVKIAVFGDYDCDGVVATALLYDYLKGRDADVLAYIPNRADEGYGMNNDAVLKLANRGVKLIITVDNGISCAHEIAYAKSLGIDTVVTDHHLPPEELPQAVAVVDPHQKDCPSSFKEICGAEVAFKLVCALDDKEPEQMLGRYADILSVATIGDVMPLVNENRSIVKAGIKKIKSAPNLGIASILNMAGIDRTTIDAGKISFGIVPRINAAGRMGSAYRAFELLVSDSAIDALSIAGPIDDDNVRRQQIEKDILKNAIETIEKNGYQYNRVIVVSGNDWHFGVLGIVASRLCERYGKSTLVLSKENGIAHGSGRSFAGFNLFDAINSCSDILVKYGGHELAAGVSVGIEDIDLFRQRINEYAIKNDSAVPKINIDFRLNPAGMSVDMAFALKTLEPFGNGNPVPVFGIFGVTIEKITPIGSGKHLKLLCRKNENAFQALMFNVTTQQFCFNIGDVVDLAVTLDSNLYQGQYSLSVQIKDIKMSDVDQDAFFESKQNFDDFVSGVLNDFTTVFPTREAVGSVYKMILASPIKYERLKFINTEIDYAKTQISVKTLCELGLVSLDNGILVAHKAEQKNDLMNSITYKKLYKEVNQGE
ncbi:MAG: single-stranded-DNA-specific exonuclease RecJ [Clostridia bacterium]|nr:single-stranded-DNA-specific exonuclease RecJ [Clostridia bacterium]